MKNRKICYIKIGKRRRRRERRREDRYPRNRRGFLLCFKKKLIGHKKSGKCWGWGFYSLWSHLLRLAKIETLPPWGFSRISPVYISANIPCIYFKNFMANIVWVLNFGQVKGEDEKSKTQSRLNFCKYCSQLHIHRWYF